MRILLTTLNSKHVHMNLALRYLYEAAGEFHSCLELREFTINNEEDHIYSECIAGNYGMICFSCYIWNIKQTLILCENLKKARPEIRIVLGGPEVSYDRDEILKEHPYLDGILLGEGERAFPALCREYLKSGQVVTNACREAMNPEEIPFPYATLPPEEDKTVYYESSRGCPFQCAYCLSSSEISVRSWPLPRVYQELEYFLQREVRQVKFIDRTFNWKEDRCCEIIDFLREKDNGVTNFHFEICGELLTDRILEALSKARKGQIQLEIGIQSTKEETLLAIHRRGDIHLAGGYIKRILSLGNIQVHLDLIAGLPLENYLDFAESFRQTYALRPSALQLGFLKMLKGTDIREMPQDHGYIYRRQPPYEVISNRYLSSGELVSLKRIEKILDLFYNKGGFSGTLEWLLERGSGEEDSFGLYEDLARYYHCQGHQNRSHKKEDLYRILLGYCLSKGLKPEEAKEILMVDMSHTMNPEAIKNFERKGFTPL